MISQESGPGVQSRLVVQVDNTRATERVIDVHGVTRTYKLGAVEVPALRGVSLAVGKGEFVAIMGASGSGKSTLLNILGCLDRPTSGHYYLDGEDVSQMNKDQLAAVRSRRLGFVFQSFNLLSRMSALKNVMLPLAYDHGQRNGHGPGHEERARLALQSVGLGERLHHRPNELSGGQQQRVAIARALINQPPLVLADEPTGNLDSKAGEEIIAILAGLNAEGVTVVLVTHEPDIAAHTNRIVRMQDGLIVSDEVQS
jgi:putative ABC transport system ATP-binding protein